MGGVTSGRQPAVMGTLSGACLAVIGTCMGRGLLGWDFAA